MCGIAGFQLSQVENKIVSPKLAEELLREIVTRGRDATGAAWLKKDNDKTEVWYSKQAVDAQRFVSNGGLKDIPNKCKTVILHTRFATKGHKSNSDNNHPIIVDGIVGVHNGHIANDDQIIADGKYARIGQVDSEAIFWQIAKSEHPVSGLEKIVGTAAVAWVEVDKPQHLHLARCAGSPLVVAQSKNGSIFFASTLSLLATALKNFGILEVEFFEVPEWTYLKTHNGKITDWLDIPHKETPAPNTHWYAHPQLPWSPKQSVKESEALIDPFGYEQEQIEHERSQRRSVPFGW